MFNTLNIFDGVTDFFSGISDFVTLIVDGINDIITFFFEILRLLLNLVTFLPEPFGAITGAFILVNFILFINKVRSGS